MNILVVDDDRLVSTSLKTIIESDPEMTVVGIGNNGLEGISLYDSLLPDILLMDIRMDQMSGIDAAKHILQLHPDAKILFLTTFSDDEYIINALKLGVKGYILKQNFESIIPSLKTVYSGQRVFGDEIIVKLPGLMSESSTKELHTFDLNDREQLIIAYIAEGLSNKEIADQMFLGEGTIRNYLSIILEKLSLRDRTQLAIFYYKHTSR
jgi:DNA-binding NarL/FixJ family response regulator